jgi:hypothetical protein
VEANASPRILASALNGVRGRILFLSVILFLLWGTAGHCRVSQTGVIFLSMNPDARGRSMGEGGGAFSAGAISVFYNPANLATVSSLSAEFCRHQLVPELSSGIFLSSLYLGGAAGRWGHYAIGYHRIGYGTQVIYDELGNTAGEYAFYEYALGVYGAFALNPNISLGGGFKYICSKLGVLWTESGIRQSKAETAAVDLGVSIRNLFPETTIQNKVPTQPHLRKWCRARNDRGIAVGLSVANLGPDISYPDVSGSAPLPRNLRLAVGYQIVDIDDLGLRATVDATKLLVDMDDEFRTEWQEIVWSYGGEVTLYYCVAVRGGHLLDRIGRTRFWTWGLGLGPEWLRLDVSRQEGKSSFSIGCNVPPQILQW